MKPAWLPVYVLNNQGWILYYNLNHPLMQELLFEKDYDTRRGGRDLQKNANTRVLYESSVPIS